MKCSFPGRAVLVACTLVAGCASVPPERVGAARDCESVLRTVDAAVDRARVRDGMAARIPGFSYLRVDRLEASFAAAPRERPQASAWIARLGELDRSARVIEIANLPFREARALRARLGSSPLVAVQCAQRLLQVETQGKETDRTHALIRERARVPDDYDLWKRVVGLYPLVSIPFSAGTRDLEQMTESVFATPIDALPRTGELTRYVPASRHALATQPLAELTALALTHNASRRVAEAEAQLRHIYAPVFEIDVADNADRPGQVGLDGAAEPQIDTAVPTVYFRTAATRYGDNTLLQLVYSIWFSERPRTGAFDLLGGKLDGITWRVTLAPDGAPLVFDSIHNCGCYHQFFPTLRAQPLVPSDLVEETAFVPQRLADVPSGSRLVLRIASHTHYLQRVFVQANQEAASRVSEVGIVYDFLPDDTLRSLPIAGSTEGERRSLFSPDGIVAGSQRGERYLFWPMGIREPGAMRQWGRQPTAFVGRRHFDDADVLQRYFKIELN